MKPLEWSTLRSISNSAFGRLAILVPFLPFVIEFARSVFSPIFSLGNAAEGIESRWGLEDTAVSSMIQGLEQWADQNLSAVVSFYVGITVFVVARLVFQFTAPRALKNDDFEERLKALLTLAKLAHEAENAVLAKRYNARARELYDASNGDAIGSEGSSGMIARWALTALFGFSLVLLVWPPVHRFLKIFLGDFVF